MSNPRLLLTVAEAAEELRVSEMTVYRLISSGDLPTSDIGTGKRARTRITRKALEEFIEARTTERRTA